MFNCFCPTFYPALYCWKGYFLVTVRVLQLRMWETAVQPLFVPCGNATGFAVTLVVTYSETDSIYFNDASVYNVRKVDFQANLCEAFDEDKKQHYCGGLVWGWGVSHKTVFNHEWTGFQSKRCRSSLKYLPSCILTYSSKRRDLTRN